MLIAPEPKIISRCWKILQLTAPNEVKEKKGNYSAPKFG
jgi:hypothetical protein